MTYCSKRFFTQNPDKDYSDLYSNLIEYFNDLVKFGIIKKDLEQREGPNQLTCFYSGKELVVSLVRKNGGSRIWQVRTDFLGKKDLVEMVCKDIEEKFSKI